MKTVRVSAVAILCASLGLVACTDKTPILPDDRVSTESATESSPVKDVNQGSSLAEKAGKAGIPVALAEAWEREGVHIADNGSVYSDTCPVSRKVHLPAGVTIRC